jgi:tetratricopeptide (TPR) repeat protein
MSDPAALAWIYSARSWRAFRHGDFGACLVLDSRVAECFTAIGDLRHACQQRANVGYDEMMLGASARAEASLTEAIAAATRIGLHQVTTQAQHNLGLVVLRQGRIDEARTIETAARDALAAQGNRRLAAASMHYLAVIEIAAGNFAASIQHSRDAIDATPDVPGLRCQFHSTLSTAYRLGGDTQAALAHASTAMQLMETHGRPEEGETEVRLAYAEALYATGSVDAARRVIAEAKLLLLESAAKIADPAWRKSYLEAVPGNAGTLALARMWGV